MTERSVDKKTEVRSDEEQPAQQDSTCNKKLREQGKAYPRTCKKCGLGTCIADRVQPAPVASPHEQQEPVAWIDICEKGQMSGLRYWSEPDNRHEVPLYTCPQPSKPWVGLTDEEVIIMSRYDLEYAALIREVQRKLKEKNT